MLMLRVLLCGALAGVASYAADALSPLTVRQVKVGGEIGRRIDVTMHNNLLALDADRDFLKPFADRSQKGGYIGLGKLILASARFAAYSDDPKVLALHQRLIVRTLASQQPDGYIGICLPEQRVHGLWDVHEMGYVIAGLLADWEFFQNRDSLAAARKAADYLLAHWSEIPPDWAVQTGVAPHVAVTGIERTLLALHRATDDQRYHDFVLRQRALAEWSLPIIIGRRPGIEGHIYAYVARTLAQLELYRTEPRQALLAASDRVMDFLTAHNGMAVTGGAGQWEIWTDDQDGRGQLAETCATAYQLRLYDSLLRLRGDSRFGDLMERTIYNTLFAAQSPDGRRIRYYSPLEGPREYHPGDTYCCPSNYRRIVAELPEYVYYRTSVGVGVNLYTTSEAKVDVAGTALSLRQKTDYPSSGGVTIQVDPAKPATFALRLRIPAWAAGSRISVNGAMPTAARPGTFHELNRQWRQGDTVRLEMPMPFRLVQGRARQAGRVAVLRGPLVFTLDPTQEKALASLDAADLSRFTIDPASLQAEPDSSVHPGGIACRAGAWKPGYSTQAKPELTLRLTEFADPAGRATYFKLRDGAQAVADELIRPASH
jgi:DUF1680 family protein